MRARPFPFILAGLAALFLAVTLFARPQVSAVPTSASGTLSDASARTPVFEAAASDGSAASDMDDDDDDADGTSLSTNSECLPEGAGLRSLDELQRPDFPVRADFVTTPPSSPCQGQALRRRIFKKS